LGVGTEVQPLPDVRRTDAARSKYDRPNGVRRRFQVNVNNVEPAVSNRCCNLLSKDNCRAALADEACPMWPEVARVCKPFTFSCGAEAGARATSRPNRSVIGPSGESDGVAPDSNAGEEMALGKTSKVGGFHFCDAALIHFSRCDDVAADQFAEPCGFVRVDFVVPIQTE
jgi:hypothetical protein